MSRTRKIVYSSLALPMIAAGIVLFQMNGDARRSFLNDYSKNLGRMFAGEWELSELRDPRRQNDVVARRGGGDYRRYNGPGAADVFARLDRDENESLDSRELGHRLSVRIGTNENVSLDRFEQTLRQPWSPQIDEEVAESGTAAGEVDETSTSTSTSTPKPELAHSRLLDPNHVMTVNVQLAESDWDSLCNQTRSHHSAVQNPLDKPYTNFRANVAIDGVLLTDVAIRKKGFIGSQDTVRPSLKIKFDEYVDQGPVVGLERLTLNNNRQDRALVSQALTYFLFRKAGLPAPRSNYAAVTVNNRYLGVYSHVESVKKPFLRRAFGDDTGKLYEGTLTDLYPKSIEWFEPKTSNSRGDRNSLTSLATVLMDESSSLDDIAAIVDIDAFLKYWAIEALINFWDGYNQNQNNFFIYEDPRDGLMDFVPWGADSCFGGRPHFVHRHGATSEAVRATSILSNRLYRMDGIPDRYRAAMREILSDVWNEQELLGEIDRIERLLRDHIDVNQIMAIVATDDVRRFIRNRRKVISTELDQNWPAEVAHGPRIPRYTESIGSAEGSFHRTEQGSYQLDANMTLDDEPVEFDQIEFEDGAFILVATHDARPLEIQLNWVEAEQSDDQSWELKGEFTNRSGRGVEIRGQLRAIQLNEAKQIVRSEFAFQVRQTRGGFMDRW